MEINKICDLIIDYYDLGFTENLDEVLSKIQNYLSIEIERETGKILQPLNYKVYNQSKKRIFNIYKYQVIAVLYLKNSGKNKIELNKKKINISEKSILIAESCDKLIINEKTDENLYIVFNYAYKYYTGG